MIGISTQSSSNSEIEDLLNLHTLPNFIAGKSPRRAMALTVSGFNRSILATSSTLRRVPLLIIGFEGPRITSWLLSVICISFFMVNPYSAQDKGADNLSMISHHQGFKKIEHNTSRYLLCTLLNRSLCLYPL